MSASQDRNALPSASSSAGSGGGRSSRSATTLASRSRIFAQSATATRTSASTRATSAASASRRDGSTTRSTSTWMKRFAPRLGRIAGRDIVERPVAAADDRDDRMDDEVQRQAVPVDFHRHRIDEERHVVVDDLDDRMRRLPAVLLDRRVEDTHARLARIALAGEIPVRQRRAVEIGRSPRGKILGVDLTEVADHETLEHFALGGRRPGLHHRQYGVELLRPAIIHQGLHRSSPGQCLADRTPIAVPFTTCRCGRRAHSHGAGANRSARASAGGISRRIAATRAPVSATRRRSAARRRRAAA